MGKPTGFMEYNRTEARSVEPKERIKNYKEFHVFLSKEKQQEQLRKKYALDKSTIARRAAKLEAGGYIERRPHPEDGRRKQLFITEKGAAIRNAKVDAESFYYEWLTAELSQEELDVLRPLLNRLQLRSRDERRQESVHLLKLYTDTHGGQSGAKK